MAGRRQLDKQRTRARISDVATRLFLQRGFEAVTVAEVAAAAGVSKVTVFAHFPRKEDLLLDRAPEAAALVGAAVRARPDAPVSSLRLLALELTEQGHPLSGLGIGARPFLQVVLASPALRARTRELLADLEQVLRDALTETGTPQPALLAALVVAAYRTATAQTVAAVAAGEPLSAVAAGHRRRLGVAFDALEAAAATLAS